MILLFCSPGGLRPPDPPPWILGSIYYPYSKYYMDHTIHILPISLYGPYGPYRSTYQRVWIVRSIKNLTYKNIWSVQSIFGSTYQKMRIVQSIYGSTFPKIVENLVIQHFDEKHKFSNDHNNNFHASKIQSLVKIRIYRKSSKKVKNWPRATKVTIVVCQDTFE